MNTTLAGGFLLSQLVAKLTTFDDKFPVRMMFQYATPPGDALPCKALKSL
jgi:hypothetical protein